MVEVYSASIFSFLLPLICIGIVFVVEKENTTNSL